MDAADARASKCILAQDETAQSLALPLRAPVCQSSLRRENDELFFWTTCFLFSRQARCTGGALPNAADQT